MTDADGSFLRVCQCRLGDPIPSDGIASLRDGSLDAIIVQDVLAPDLCRTIVRTLEANAAGFEVTEFPGPFRSFFYGRNLNLNEPDLDAYFAAARTFSGALERLGGMVGVDIFGQIVSVLTRLNAGCPAVPAPGPGGAAHFFTTFRGHRPGGYIPAHFDNEQSYRPSYRHVATVTTGYILSFVLTLSEADRGGMLELFDFLAEDPAAGIRNDDDGPRKPDLSAIRSQRLPVPAGTMVIVNSGRRLHRVVPVEGETTRWTICSFMARAADSNTLCCWG